MNKFRQTWSLLDKKNQIRTPSAGWKFEHHPPKSLRRFVQETEFKLWSFRFQVYSVSEGDRKRLSINILQSCKESASSNNDHLRHMLWLGCILFCDFIVYGLVDWAACLNTLGKIDGRSFLLCPWTGRTIWLRLSNNLLIFIDYFPTILDPPLSVAPKLEVNSAAILLLFMAGTVVEITKTSISSMTCILNLIKIGIFVQKLALLLLGRKVD
jgi:hypothetical protein